MSEYKPANIEERCETLDKIIETSDDNVKKELAFQLKTLLQEFDEIGDTIRRNRSSSSMMDTIG